MTARPRPSDVPLALPNCGKSRVADREQSAEAEQIHGKAEHGDGDQQIERQLARTCCGRLRGGLGLRRLLDLELLGRGAELWVGCWPGYPEPPGG